METGMSYGLTCGLKSESTPGRPALSRQDLGKEAVEINSMCRNLISEDIR